MSNMGHSKHRKSGHSVSAQHFTGKKKSSQKTKRKGELTRKQRKLNRGTHLNKYETEKG